MYGSACTNASTCGRRGVPAACSARAWPICLVGLHLPTRTTHLLLGDVLEDEDGALGRLAHRAAQHELARSQLRVTHAPSPTCSLQGADLRGCASDGREELCVYCAPACRPLRDALPGTARASPGCQARTCMHVCARVGRLIHLNELLHGGHEPPLRAAALHLRWRRPADAAAMGLHHHRHPHLYSRMWYLSGAGGAADACRCAPSAQSGALPPTSWMMPFGAWWAASRELCYALLLPRSPACAAHQAAHSRSPTSARRWPRASAPRRRSKEALHLSSQLCVRFVLFAAFARCACAADSCGGSGSHGQDQG